MLLDFVSPLWPLDFEPGSKIHTTVADRDDIKLTATDRMAVELTATDGPIMQIRNTKVLRFELRVDDALVDPSALVLDVWNGDQDPRSDDPTTYVLGVDAEIRTVAVGIYEADIAVGTISGAWHYAWTATEPNAYRESWFRVDRSFTAS